MQKLVLPVRSIAKLWRKVSHGGGGGGGICSLFGIGLKTRRIFPKSNHFLRDVGKRSPCSGKNMENLRKAFTILKI